MEEASEEEDKKRFEWLSKKIGSELTAEIVYGVPDEKAKMKLKKRGITLDVIRDDINTI